MGEITGAEVMSRICEYCRKVNNEFKLKKIILFGSYARGDHFPNSDIDLLLVSDEFHDDWFKRHARLYYLKVRRIEPFGYTSHELQQLIEVGNPFIEIILKEGKELPLEDILGTNL